jgi:hypothetical protein
MTTNVTFCCFCGFLWASLFTHYDGYLRASSPTYNSRGSFPFPYNHIVTSICYCYICYTLTSLPASHYVCREVLCVIIFFSVYYNDYILSSLPVCYNIYTEASSWVCCSVVLKPLSVSAIMALQEPPYLSAYEPLDGVL